jgi:uncharacterized protein (DUF2249 family)
MISLGRRFPFAGSGSTVTNEHSEEVWRVFANGISELKIDLRGVDAAIRRTLVFSILDKLVELGASEEVVLVCDHEPAGLGYQIDLRRETRGLYEFSYNQRGDGAFVAFLRPKCVRESAEKVR